MSKNYIVQYIGMCNDMLWHCGCGRCGGTMGAVATCPLEVVKTRLQSSSFSYMSGNLPPPAAQPRPPTTCSTLPRPPYHHDGGSHGSRRLCTSACRPSTQIVHLSQQLPDPPRQRQTLSIFHCLKWVLYCTGICGGVCSKGLSDHSSLMPFFHHLCIG